MKRITGIYCITNTKTNKKYIGKSVDILSRFRSHRTMLNKNEHHSVYLQNSWNKYGGSYFIFGVISEYDKEVLAEKESYWVDYYDTYNNGYNCAKIITSQNSRVFDEKQKLHTSEYMKELYLDPKYRAKMKIARNKAKATRIKNLELGIIKNKPEEKHNIRIYDKNTLEIKHTFDYYSELAKFLGKNKVQTMTLLGKLDSPVISRWTHGNCYILHNDMTIEFYLNRKLITNLNTKIRRSKEAKITRLKNLKENPPKTREEVCSVLKANSLKAVEKLRKNSNYRVIVTNREYTECLGIFPLLADACNQLGFKPQYVSKVWKKNRVYYRGYNFTKVENILNNIPYHN